MPLIQITTKHKYFPPARKGTGIATQRMTTDFARALPSLFVAESTKLRMEPGTPETGVQVTHQRFHPQDVNAPDMWLLIQFSESGLTNKQQLKVKSQVKKIVLGWFGDNGFVVPENIAVDCFWGPSHGFLSIGGTLIEW